MTPEQVSALCNTQLNLKMISIVFGKDWQEDRDLKKAYTSGRLNYLTDYNITMPLAFINDLSISICNSTKRKALVLGGDYFSYDNNPLRAICECLVLIGMANKKC